MTNLVSTMACKKNSPHVHEASPGTRMLFLSIYLSYLLHMIPCSYWASTCLAVLPSCSAYMLRVTSGRRFANRFLQLPRRQGHPCLKLYPSRYRADSGLAPVRTCARRAHEGMGVSGIGQIRDPQKEGVLLTSRGLTDSTAES